MHEYKKIQPVDTPAWMDLAWHEYQLWQQNRWTTNTLGGLQRAQNYIDSTREYFSPKTAGWCGCFAHWVIKKTNELYGTSFSTVIRNPSGSQNYATRKRYPGSKKIRPRLHHIPYGILVVLKSLSWQGHVGFLVNHVKIGKKRYVYLLGGNQDNKVCVQAFLVYRQGNRIFYQTNKGKIFTLKCFVSPCEYNWEEQGNKAFEYCTQGYDTLEKSEHI